MINKMREHENEDYKVMLENKKHEFKYYIRDVFTFSEIKDLKEFCKEILEDKIEGGLWDD